MKAISESGEISEKVWKELLTRNPTEAIKISVLQTKVVYKIWTENGPKVASVGLFPGESP